MSNQTKQELKGVVANTLIALSVFMSCLLIASTLII